jgi:hypothetical protein
VLFPDVSQADFFASSVMMFKAKANAEKEKYEAQGEKAGEDFLDCKYLVFKHFHWRRML